MEEVQITFENDGAFVTLLSGQRLIAYVFLSRPALDEMFRVLTEDRSRRRPQGDLEEIQGDA